MKEKTNTEILVESFLKKAGEIFNNINFEKVLKARIYKIENSNILIRAASEGNKSYFFGINYITIEEMANLDNPFIAFICGSIDQTIIIPADELFKNLSNISHDRNGEYKININRDLNISLSGRGNKLICSEYVNAWNLLKKTPANKLQNSLESSYHSIIQGRLIEIGNIRGFQTFCPNKNKNFNGRSLEDLSTIKRCPELQFSDYDLLRQIDVLWFREKGSNLIPDSAFEVEISTGTWSGVGRLATLLDYNFVRLFIISNEKKKYDQVMHSYYENHARYKHVITEAVGDLYSAELNLKELRKDIGL